MTHIYIFYTLHLHNHFIYTPLIFLKYSPFHFPITLLHFSLKNINYYVTLNTIIAKQNIYILDLTQHKICHFLLTTYIQV